MVLVHFAEGFEEIEALMVIDVLRRADIEVQMVSVTGQLMVAGSHNIAIKADVLFEDADYNHAEMLVLPGGLPGTINLDAHEGFKQKLSQFAGQNKWIAAICAAPMILGKMQLLKGQNAVCYPGWEKYLEGARLIDAPYVISDHFITGKGVGVAQHFALSIVQTLKGAESAKDLAHKMLVKDFR